MSLSFFSGRGRIWNPRLICANGERKCAMQTGEDSRRILIRRFAVELADYPTMPLIVTAIATSAVKIMPHKIALSDSSLVRASVPRDICR
jgi:hypothetical protein